MKKILFKLNKFFSRFKKIPVSIQRIPEVIKTRGLSPLALPVDSDSSTLLSEITRIFSQMKSLQETFKTNKEKFFQGVNKNLNLNGKILSTFNRTLRPTDQTEDWTGFNLPEMQTYLDYFIDIYDGPFGKGYTINATFKNLNTRYLYSRHFGPEKYRDAFNDTWREFTDAI